MVGFSEGSLVANWKNWARRSTRKGRIVAKQSRTTTTAKAEQSQRTSSVTQHLATTSETEQSQHASFVSQHLTTTTEAERSQHTSLVAQHPETAVEAEQSRRTSCRTNISQ